MRKLIKVRIAVAVDCGENWSASGWKSEGMEEPASDDAMATVLEEIADGAACYWLEAYLDVPEVKVVLAAVSKQECPT